MKKFCFIIIFFFHHFQTLEAQWQQTDGPSGGKILGLFNDNGIINISFIEGGMFIDSSNTRLLKSVSAPGFNIMVRCGYQIYALEAGSGVLYHSEDSGKTWNVSSSCPVYSGVRSITSLGNVIFAGNYHSIDSGVSWLFHSSGMDSILALATMGSIIFASTHDSIYLSTDTGNHWTVRSALGSSDLFPFGTRLFARNSGMMMSSDSGASWQSINGNLFPPVNPDLFFASDTSTLFISIHDTLFRSINNGLTWTIVNNGINGYVKAFCKRGNELFAGTIWGLYHSTDSGNSWSQSNNGLYTSYVTSLCTDNNKISAGIASTPYVPFRLFTTVDQGNTWTLSNNGLLYGDVSFLGNDGNSLYCGMSTLSSGYVYRSTDNGQSWTPLNIYLPGPTAIAFQGSNIFVSSGSSYGFGVFLSTDNGQTWDSINNGLTNWTQNSVRDIKIFGNTIIRASYGGVYLSNDTGNSWYGNNIFSANSIGIVGQNIIISGYGGPYMSTDTGYTWNQLITLPAFDEFRFLTIGGYIFAGSTQGSGIFLSIDSGFTWTNISSGLNGIRICALTADSSYLYAANCRRGPVYKSALSNYGISGVDEVAIKNELYVYPNPSSGKVTIRSLPSSDYNIDIYSVTGQKIFSKTNPRSISEMKIENLRQGIYILIYSSNDKVVSKKLLVY